MHRLLAGAAVAASLTLAACGGSSNNEAPAARAASSDTVGIQQVTGIGRVLVDSSGMALYTPSEERSGKIVCTGSCTSEWQPVQADGTPTAASGAGRVGVIKRPDGARQVTLAGMPLYTFAQDSPGQITGDGFQDKFGGTSFTWHVVLAGGRKGTGAATDTNDSSSNYGY
jgi:predicted lipoprotein with Yx(FWY)xxD motif